MIRVGDVPCQTPSGISNCQSRSQCQSLVGSPLNFATRLYRNKARSSHTSHFALVPSFKLTKKNALEKLMHKINALDNANARVRGIPLGRWKRDQKGNVMAY